MSKPSSSILRLEAEIREVYRLITEYNHHTGDFANWVIEFYYGKSSSTVHDIRNRAYKMPFCQTTATPNYWEVKKERYPRHKFDFNKVPVVQGTLALK